MKSDELKRSLQLSQLWLLL